MKLSPGDLIDQKYRIVGLLGQGGMGSVYAAENIRISRRVAIKVLERAGNENDVIRFEREARATQIGSPHIVQVYDLGNLDDGTPYMIMEYLAGESLGNRLSRRGVLEPSEIIPIAIQVLDGLAAAHRVGLAHRDLKPDNVFLVRLPASDQELAKLLDFGISKFVNSSRRSCDPALTQSGMAVGTPHYMSPEQVEGGNRLDTRTDLYSLGVILYQCLSGRLPFATHEIARLLSQILLESPSPLATVVPGFDPELSRIVATAMARRADDRYQTAADLRRALIDWAPRIRGSTLPTAEVPPVELARSATVFLRRGLLGCLAAAVSAASAVGTGKLVFGPNLERQTPWISQRQPASAPSPVPAPHRPKSDPAQHAAIASDETSSQVTALGRTELERISGACTLPIRLSPPASTATGPKSSSPPSSALGRHRIAVASQPSSSRQSSSAPTPRASNPRLESPLPPKRTHAGADRPSPSVTDALENSVSEWRAPNPASAPNRARHLSRQSSL